jgi:hypothetical protein
MGFNRPFRIADDLTDHLAGVSQIAVWGAATAQVRNVFASRWIALGLHQILIGVPSFPAGWVGPNRTPGSPVKDPR